MENIGTGLMLMVVGMATVFLILLIVIYLSQLLIKIVNKVAPEEVVQKSLLLFPIRITGRWMLSRLLWIFLLQVRVK